MVHNHVYARITLVAVCNAVTPESPPWCLVLDKAVIGGKKAGRLADLHCYRMTKQSKGQRVIEEFHRRMSNQ